MVSKEFVLAGNSIFTVKSASGEYITFKVSKKEASNGYSASWFCNVLTGPDNTSSYTYLGLLDQLHGDVRLTRASRYNHDSKPYKVLRWALSKVWSGESLPEGYEVKHEGRCGRCGRVLTTPDSIDAGIGPECAKKMG